MHTEKSYQIRKCKRSRSVEPHPVARQISYERAVLGQLVIHVRLELYLTPHANISFRYVKELILKLDIE